MDWRFLLYSAWFQLVWFIAVIGNQQLQWLTAFLAVLTLLYSQVREPIKFERFALLAGVGIALDCMNSYAGLFVFDSKGIPIWLVSLWLVFLWYAYFLLQKLKMLPSWLTTLLGGAGGALSYIAGEKLSAVNFTLTLGMTGLIVFVEWAVMFWLIRKVYGYEGSKPTHYA